jgi:hypothetical protein
LWAKTLDSCIGSVRVKTQMSHEFDDYCNPIFFIGGGTQDYRVWSYLEDIQNANELLVSFLKLKML